eukprot:gnl/Chilomastix_cuspidata/59.p1 GENE.gnl/Chilomastix_cuspidata/59~~gnl/Chilomastix_cuspidata/59.p1  ORF type:complete len:749 (-),score=483.45 gnl/Chilomastix_cuspidata/59:2567-4813(-)
MAETHKFQAEISQLMGLIINTFYSNKEIFLRELISNASDALDKIRYQALTDPAALAADPSTKIQIIPRPDEKVLIVRDTGLGMTKTDLVTCLGTIARSGTKLFMEALEAGGDISLIGQFGVGFYSAFLVADVVDVYSKHNDDECYVWSSSAGGSFTIAPADRPDLARGTEIHLHLKEGCEEFGKADKCRDIIKTHSQFVDFPIELLVVKEEEVEEEVSEGDAPAEEEAAEAADGEEPEAEAEAAEEDEDEAEAKPKTKKVKKRTEEFERVNVQTAIWCRKPEDVTHEEYVEFYKHLTNDWEEHLAVKHFHVEGHVDFKGIIYIPKRAPFDMFEQRKKKVGVKLMVRKVFITDECTELLPEWLGFVKGIVDSDDLPLNISRETLQKNLVIANMKKVIVKKVIELLTELAEGTYTEGRKDEKPEEEKPEEEKPEEEGSDDESDDDDDEEEAALEKWKTFTEQFSKNLKLGVHEDTDNRPKLAALLRYHSTKSTDEPTSLDEYVERMPEHQKNIYYITGESRKHCETSPFLEALVAKDFEVLFMDQAIDEYAVSTLRDYKEKKLQCITKDGLELEESDDEKKQHEEDKAKFSKLVDFVKEVLGDKVEAVKLGYRLTSSPCVLTTSEWGWSAQMQRVMKAQALRDDSMTSVMCGKATMEINPRNKIVRTLLKKLEESEDDPTVRSSVTLLYETALISSGFSLDDVSAYAGRIFSMMSFGLCDDDAAEPEDVPALVQDAEDEPEDDGNLEDVD